MITINVSAVFQIEQLKEDCKFRVGVYERKVEAISGIWFREGGKYAVSMT
jgi:hypothetical protein